MFCPVCGKQIPDDSRFCPMCGTSLSRWIPVEPLTPPVETPAAPTEPLTPPVETPEALTEPLTPPVEPPEALTEPLTPPVETPEALTEPLTPPVETPEAPTEPLTPSADVPIIPIEPVIPPTDTKKVPTEPLAPPEPPVETAAAPMSGPITAPLATADAENGGSAPPAVPGGSENKPKGGKRSKALVVALAVVAVVLAAAAGAAVFLLGGRGGGTGYVYLTDGGELEYLADLKENTKSVKLSDEGNLYSRVTFSPDGKYLYYVAVEEDEYVGNLYQAETAKLGRERYTALRISPSVSSFALLANGDLVYQKNRGNDNQLWLYHEAESVKLAGDVGSFYGVSDDQSWGYYTEYDGDDTNLIRVALTPDGEKETVLTHFDTLYSAFDAVPLVYGETDSTEYPYTYTVYAVGAGGEKEQLVKDVTNVMGVQTTDGEISFYYTTREEEEYSFYDLVSDRNRSADEADATEEPEYPDWSGDYMPYYGIYTADDGREYYESYSGNIYYLDPAAYPDMDSVSMAYEIADKLYDEALEEYNAAYDDWYQVQERNDLRSDLKNQTYSLTSYTIFRYAGGESREVASRLSTDYLYMEDGALARGVLYYNKVPVVSGELADVSDLNGAYEVYDLASDRYAVDYETYYQNVGGVESELDVEGSDIYLYFLSDDEAVFRSYTDGGDTLSLYTLGENGLTYADTIVENDGLFVCGVYDGALYYYTDVDEDSREGDLYRFVDGTSEKVLSGIASLMEVGEGKNRYALAGWDYDNRAGTSVAELYLVNADGSKTPIHSDVHAWRLWFLDEEQVLFIADSGLYCWDGKESHLLASDVQYVWVSGQEGYESYSVWGY